MPRSHLPTVHDVEFVTITARIIVPGLGDRLVLTSRDRFGLGWYGDQGFRLAAILIQRAGESMLHVFKYPPLAGLELQPTDRRAAGCEGLR